MPFVEEAPLQGPFAFKPGFARVAGSLPLLIPVLPVPMPVVPGVVVLGEDMPDVLPVDEPLVEPPAEVPPPAAPAAPPPAPPPPPPAANAELLETANVAAKIAVVSFIIVSCPSG